MSGNTTLTTTLPFSGRSNRLDGGISEQDRDKKNKIKVSATIRSAEKGTIREAKFHNLSFNEKFNVASGIVLRKNQIVVVDQIYVFYQPYVNEYVSDYIKMKLITLHNKTPKTILSHMFRASDSVSADIHISWQLNIENGDLKNGLLVEYSCGNKSHKTVLGRLTVYMGGYMSNRKDINNEQENRGLVGRLEVDSGNFGTDMSCSKYFYPSGNYKAVTSPVISCLKSIMDHLAYNGINVSVDRLFDVLSSLPLIFAGAISNINDSHWRFTQTDTEFLEYVSTGAERVVEPAISFGDHKKFLGERHISVRYTRT